MVSNKTGSIRIYEIMTFFNCDKKNELKKYWIGHYIVLKQEVFWDFWCIHSVLDNSRGNPVRANVASALPSI